MSRDLANDALCQILSVTVYPADYHRDALGELRTDFGETFGLFDITLMILAEHARAKHERVRLVVRTSRAGNRYVKGITPLDQGRNPTPCVSCQTLAPKVAATPEIPEHFACGSCHLLMFLQPITRSYGD